MNPLESRKQLLISESELNRAQLVGDWAAVTEGVHSLTDRAKSLGSMASAAALLLSGLATFRRAKSASTAAKPSRFQSILKSVGMVSTLWLAFRSCRRDHEIKQPNSRA